MLPKSYNSIRSSSLIDGENIKILIYMTKQKKEIL